MVSLSPTLKKRLGKTRAFEMRLRYSPNDAWMKIKIAQSVEEPWDYSGRPTTVEFSGDRLLVAKSISEFGGADINIKPKHIPTNVIVKYGMQRVSPFSLALRTAQSYDYLNCMLDAPLWIPLSLWPVTIRALHETCLKRALLFLEDISGREWILLLGLINEPNSLRPVLTMLHVAYREFSLFTDSQYLTFFSNRKLYGERVVVRKSSLQLERLFENYRIPSRVPPPPFPPKTEHPKPSGTNTADQQTNKKQSPKSKPFHWSNFRKFFKSR
jgi:hypothetical protein